MVEEDLARAISLINEGEIDQGRKILLRLVKENPELEEAWLRLHLCAETKIESVHCLYRILRINPHNKEARVMLEQVVKGQPDDLEIVENKYPEPTSKETTKTAPKKQKRKKKTSKQEQKPVSQGENESTEEEETPNPNPITIIVTNDISSHADGFQLPPSIFPETDSAMYGSRLTIGGITITPTDHPLCITVGYILPKSRCFNCEYYSPSECPFRRNPHILHEAHILFSGNKHYWKDYRERRDKIINAIYYELKEHGRPLHYDVIARIMKDRHPGLNLNSRRVLRLMSFHPEKFEWVDQGVYRAK